MFLMRKLGAVLRGKATPLQVQLATILGGMLGFLPGFFLAGHLSEGFGQAPGLLLLLVTLILVLNANLALFALVTLVAKALSLLLLPVTYAIGEWLLQTFPELFRSLINGRFTAWLGLEYYATTGGLLLGAVVGLACGLLINRLLAKLRARMADAEQHSERYQRYAGKWWVRLLAFVFLGSGKGKKLTWQELADKKGKGLPIRIPGVLAAAILVGGIFVIQQWFSAPLLTRNLRDGLQAVNGATVDLELATVELGGGVLRMRGLAIADSKQPTKDLLAADELVGTLDMEEFWRRRIVIDELRATKARAGTSRKVPAEVFPPKQPPVTEPPVEGGVKTIEEYLAEFEQWKARLQQLQEWLSVLRGTGEAPPKTPEEAEQRRTAQETALGLARVAAEHLREPAPRFLIRKISIEGIDCSISGTRQQYDLRASSISSTPSLVAEVMKVTLQDQGERRRFELLGPSSTSTAIGFGLLVKELPVDALFGSLKLGGTPPLQGGTIDFDSSGFFTEKPGAPLQIDLPIRVNLRDTTFALAGARQTKVENLLLPVGLRGSLTRPAVLLDDLVLRDALLAAGKQELANFVQQHAGSLLGRLPASLQGALDLSRPPAEIAKNLQAAAEQEAQQQIEAAKAKAEAEAARLQAEAQQKLDDAKAKAEAEANRLKAEAQKQLDDAKAKAEAEARQKLEAEARKRLPGGLPGLLPGGKKN